MVNLNIVKIIGVGLAALVGFLFVREAYVKGIGATLSEFGQGGVEVGKGIQSVLGGFGRGSAALLTPFFGLADLIAKFSGVISGSLTTPTLGGSNVPATPSNPRAPMIQSVADQGNLVVTPSTRERSDVVTTDRKIWWVITPRQPGQKGATHVTKLSLNLREVELYRSQGFQVLENYLGYAA